MDTRIVAKTETSTFALRLGAAAIDAVIVGMSFTTSIEVTMTAALSNSKGKRLRYKGDLLV